MLRSVNPDNWQLAQREGAWGTQPHNEEKFGAAFRGGQEVVFFVSVQSSGAIQGYGRMTSLPGKAAQVPWQDIDHTRVNNFYVSWDCAAPIPFDKLQELANPWNDPRMGARSTGKPLPLSRHRDGQELAPQIGEQLIDAMNSHAARVGQPATGLLAEGVPAARRRSAGLAPAAGGAAGAGGPGWQQQQQFRQGGAGPQQQMHMQQQQRMMMLQQQQRGGMGGRGMMGAPMGQQQQHGRGPMPGGRMMMQQQQPPPPARPISAGGGQGHGRGPAGPAMHSDPRLNPRFAGRLKMDGVDDLPANGAAGGRGGRSPPGYGRERDDWERERGGQYDRRYEREQEGADWERGSSRHGSRGRRHSRSRSRSPPRAANSSRGGSTGRAGGGGGAGVAESSWGYGGSSPERVRHEEEPESIEDMSYEQYLALYEKVQQRIQQVKQVTSTTQQQPEQQLQLALLPGPPQEQQQLPGPPQQRQQMAGAGGMGMRGGVRGGGMARQAGGGGGGMMAAGGPSGDAAWQGPAAAAAAGGAVGPGRPADNPNKIPTLAE